MGSPSTLTCTTEAWLSPRESVESNNKLPDEWEGRGTIAHITDTSIKRFLSLPPEVHERLQLASAQLTAQQMAVQQVLSSNQPFPSPNKSAVQQYELARLELDKLDNLPAPTLKPKPSTRTRGKLQLQVQLQAREATENAYLHSITSEISTWTISRSSLEQKEEFRITLSRWALDAVIDRLKLSQQVSPTGPISVALQCFGSYRAGFALPGSDMDLIVATENLPSDVQRELPLLLAQAFLSRGLAPYLLQSIKDNRSPVLRVCQTPSQRFRDILEWEYLDLETASELKAFTSVPLACCRSSTPINHCNIYFDNAEPMLRSTDLLRGYRICDDRVYEMAQVVKRWAKARRINDPYNGTLSSYGYTLMLLHYLMNVVVPPVIPNLHKCTRKGTSDVQRAQGQPEDCFWRNPREIAKEAARGKLTANNQPTASLLRGFFAYYSGPYHDIKPLHKPTSGLRFNWKNGVVSIREPKTTKMEKNWTTCRTGADGNTHRYLLAIEDPITTDHNVAKMVTIIGVYLIREEFRHAHDIITRARPVPGTDLAWQMETGEICEDLFTERPALSF
ncbi:poly(A) polymerase Cid1 [Arthroderma uncinatum]|uniref:poly(A) polymerase Cid1 n=1 Tax=Arthroderma uncinatum TaxID=74035 RepID=UPI00144A5BC5|nr:poly(A) polymerase Cid1 [Arthroderma uncinatum]KAF3480999.1 poly(A) polymerase Cid1 [Arthroderma uncinatum]